MRRSAVLKIDALVLLAAVMVSSGFSCKLTSSKEKELLKPVELSWWGTFDNPEDLSDVIGDYSTIHPHIKVTYRKLREDEFETELLDALAEDRGPDIISIQNNDLDRWLPKLVPLPPSTELAYQFDKNSLGLKKETIIEIKKNTSLTPPQLREQFLDVVYGDVVRAGEIYALPLTVDTLVMFYNRDLFNTAGLPLPPASWSDLQGHVTRLTFQNREGELIQSGAALGTIANIEGGVDVLSLLMLQNGAQMAQNGQVLFHTLPPGGDRIYNPGPEAIRFYTDFANPTKEVYTWNDRFPDSIDAFIEGKVAIIFGYNQHRQFIEARRQGKLNYEVVGVPQIEGRPAVNIARYPIHAVSRKTADVNEAGDFRQFIARRDEVKKYLDRTKRLTALRSLVSDQTSNDELRVFAEQLLTSVSWYHGRDAAAMERAFDEMTTAVLKDNIPPADAAELAAQKIQQTF